MANRYWVGGTNTWNATAGSKWSLTSGGAGGEAVPTAADDVFFDAASGAVTVTFGSVVARSINCTGFTGTWSQSASTTLTIGDGTAGAGNVALLLVAGMTYSPAADTRAISFVSTSGTTQTITWGGKKPGNVTFDGAGGNWRVDSLMDGRVASATTFTVTRGSVDFNGNLGTFGIFSSTNTNTRSITLGASTVTIGGGGTPWNFTTSSGLTFSGASSTITFTSNFGATFQPGNRTFGVVNFTGTGATASYNINGAGTHGTLNISGPTNFNLAVNQTVTSQLNLIGSATSRLLLRSNTLGFVRTITKTGATVTAEHVDFRDITFSSGTTDLSAITGGSGDLGGNSGITFTTAANQYWVGNAGNMNDVNKWASSSGGTGGTGRVPLAQDTAIFDVNSITSASQTIAGNILAYPNLDFTGVLNSPTFTSSSSSPDAFYGSITFISAMAYTQLGTVSFLGRGTNTITMAGNIFTAAVSINMLTGSLTMLDALTISGGAAGTLTVTSGTFNTGGYNLSISSLFTISSTPIVNAENSTITLSRSGSSLFQHSSPIVTGTSFAGATILITDCSVVGGQVAGPTSGDDLYIGNIVISAANQVVQFSGQFVFGDFTINAPRQVRFSTITPYIIDGDFNAVGTAGNIITIDSTSPGTPHTLSKASGTVICDYLSLQDSTATGGAVWYAGANSTNVSGNTGWIFTAPPSPFLPGGSGWQMSLSFAISIP